MQLYKNSGTEKSIFREKQCIVYGVQMLTVLLESSWRLRILEDIQFKAFRFLFMLDIIFVYD